MEFSARQKLHRFIAYFCAWTAFGLFNFSRELTRRLYWHEPAPWREMLAAWMVGIYLTAALTPLVLQLGRRWPIERRTWRTRVPLHLAASITFSFVEIALETVVYIQLGMLEPVLKHSFL